MAKAERVTISLPADVLERVERQREAREETRSEFVVHAVKEWLRRDEEREAEELYVRAYQETPETEEEYAGWENVVAAAWADLPWEDE